jgi:hypothetical protein
LTLPQLKVFGITDAKLERRSADWWQRGEDRLAFRKALHKYCGGPLPEETVGAAVTAAWKDEMKARRLKFTGKEELTAD